MRQRNEPDLIGYGICAFILAVIIYNTWHFIILAFALMGAWCLFKHHNRPPGCR